MLSVLLFSSSAYASITVKSTTNSLGVEGYRRTSDVITINITSSNESLRISGIDGVPFDCEKTAGSFNCIAVLEDEQNSPSVSYLISNGLGEETTAVMKIDNSIGDITYNIENIAGNITLTYNVVDRGYENNIDCSRINMIEVYDSGNNINVFDINSSSCIASGSEILSITDSGEKEFYIKVFDRVGNEKESDIKIIFVDVTPPEVSNLMILYMNKELTTVSTSSEFNVDFVFDVFESSINKISLDISQFHSNPAVSQGYKNIDVPLTNCILNNSDSENTFYHCTLKNQKIKISKTSATAIFYVSDNYGGLGTASIEKTFTIDNTKPNAVQIVSGRVSSTGKSYIKDGLNKISIKVDKNNFETRRVYFKVGSNGPFRVINCTDSECFAYVPLKCESGSSIDVFITTMNADYSQDDAGNKMPSFSATMYCDNSKPEFLKAVIFGNYKVGEASLIVSGSQLTIISEIADAYTDEITAYAFLDRLKNSSEKASCAKVSEGKFNCTWVVPNIIEGYYTANIKMNFTDVAGNIAEKQQSVQVLGFKSDNLTPSSLAIYQGGGFPSSINRVALDLALLNGIQYPIYAKYTLTATSSNVKVLYQQVEDCYYKGTDGKLQDASIAFSDIKVHDPYLDVGNVNRLDLTFDAIDVNALHDSFTIFCNISAYVQEGNNVYRKPQILVTESTFTLKNSKLGEPGQAFVDKIKEVENRANSTTYQWIGKLNSWITTLQSICDVKQYLDMADQAGVAIKLVGMVTQSIDGGATKNTGAFLSNSVQKADGFLWNSKGGKGTGILSEACMFATCSLPFQEDLKKFWDFETKLGITAVTDKIGKSQWVPDETMMKLSESNLKNSMAMSTLTLCLPGMVYNANKYRQIECQYLLCLKEQSVLGLDVSICEQEKSTKQCSILVGEAFELPFMRLGKNFATGVSSVAKFGISKGLTKIVDMIMSKVFACADPTSDISTALCQIPHSVQQLLSTAQVAKNQGSFHYESKVDFCDAALCSGAPCYKSLNLNLPKAPLNTAKTKSTQVRPLDYLGDAAYSNPEKSQENIKKWNSFVEQWNSNSQNPRLDKLELNAKPGEIREYYYANKDKFKDQTILIEEYEAPEDPDDWQSASYEYLNQEFKKADAAYTQYVNIFDSTQGTSRSTDIEQAMKEIPVGADFPTMKQKAQEKRAEKIATATGQKVYASLDEAANQDKCAVDQKYSVYYLDENGNLIKYVITPNENPFEQSVDCAFVNLNDPICDKYDELKTERDTAERYVRQKQISQGMDMALRFAWDALNLNEYLTSSHLMKQWFGVENDPLTTVSEASDPERFKNSLCAPGNMFIGDAAQGYAYQCIDGIGCKVVLTFGAEKLYYNETHYMYTMVLMMGPVDKDVKFNIEFTCNKGTIKGFAQDKLLSKENTVTITRAFLRDDDCSKITITFNDKFPPSGANRESSFWREIKPDIFNTGAVPSGEDIYGDSSYGSTGGGRTTGSGFLE